MVTIIRFTNKASSFTNITQETCFMDKVSQSKLLHVCSIHAYLTLPKQMRVLKLKLARPKLYYHRNGVDFKTDSLLVGYQA